MLVGAILLGFITAFLVYKTLQDNKREMDAKIAQIAQDAAAKNNKVVQLEKPPSKTVVFAKMPIQPRAQIEEAALTTKEVPVDLVPAGAILTTADAVGKFADRRIDPDEMLTTGKVKSRAQIGSLSYTLTPGMRALALRVATEDKAAGNMINDQDYVDLLLTDDSGTRTILQNVKVLGFPGGQPRDQTEGIPRRPVETVIFEVTPQEAEAMTAVSGMGVISMTLRSVHDKEIVKLKGIAKEDIANNPGVIQSRANSSLSAVEQRNKEAEQQQNNQEASDANKK